MKVSFNAHDENGKMTTYFANAFPVSDREKIRRISRALRAAIPGGLSRWDLISQTHLTDAQYDRGWRKYKHLTEPDGLIPMVRTARDKTLYFLSDKASDGNEYVLWQGKHALTRNKTLVKLARRLARVTERFPEQQHMAHALSSALESLLKSQGHLESVVDQAARRLGYDDEEIRRWLSEVEEDDLSDALEPEEEVAAG